MRSLLLALALSVPMLAAADEPTIVVNPGQPVEAVWPSGNRAQMNRARAHAIAVPVDFQVTENDCTSAGIGQRLKVIIGLRLDIYSWVWTQHSDPNKLNRDVTARRPDGKESPLSLGVIVSNGSRYIDPGSVEGLPPDEIEFTDGAGFLPGMEDGVLKPLRLDSWNSEFMVRNSQTGAGENRIISGEIAPGISPLTETRARIDHSPAGGFFNDLLNHGFFLFGDVVTWIIPKNGGVCQIAFKPDLSGVQTALNEYVGTIKIEPKPYTDNEPGFMQALLRFYDDQVRNAVE